MTKDQSTSLTINVNGETCQMDTADRTLLEVLREDFRLTGTKKACDNGECGSCIDMPCIHHRHQHNISPAIYIHGRCADDSQVRVVI